MGEMLPARIDAHQHFWAYNTDEYPWIPTNSPLHRDWLPDNLMREQYRVGIGGSIAVQARQSVLESEWLLGLSDHHSSILGVVGWVDLRSDRVEEDLERLTEHPKFVGVRHVAQDEPDDCFLARSEFSNGIGKLRQFSLTYDLLIYPRQLTAAIELVQQHPAQSFVLDHIAKPQIRVGARYEWERPLRELAQSKNVCCKLSGMVTEADHRHWRREDLWPYLDVVFEAFDPERLMWGSDWPVCLLAAQYEDVYGIVDEYTRELSGSTKEGIFGRNAARFYLESRG